MIRVGVALVSVLGAVLVGCGAEQPDAGAPPPSPEPTVTAPGSGTGKADDPAEVPDGVSEAPLPTGEVPERLRFEAKTVDGEVFAGKDLYGSPAVLWFWAPWCPTCQAEAPTIAAAAKIEGVRFVGVAAQDQVPAMREFVDRFSLGSFPHLADTDAEIWRRFDVTYQPAYAFVSANGDIEVEKDLLEPEELMKRVRALR